jgi:hypothetical protein
MGYRHWVLVVASLALAACSQSPAPVTYLSTGSAGQDGLILAAAPIPQPKPGATATTVTGGFVDPITLMPVPPVPARKPGTESAVVVVEPPSEPAQIVLDEDIVLVPPAPPAGQVVTVQAGDTVYALSRR